MTVFIAETRNHKGERYPLKTIHALLSGILRFMRLENPSYPNFSDKSDPSFKTFQTAIDNLYKQLSSDRIGADAQPTEGISPEEEDILWKAGTLNVTTPKGLLRAAFFVCGKCFCLGRGAPGLGTISTTTFEEPNHRYVYVENSSKNRPGGINQMKLSHKSVSVVASESSGDRSPVSILDLYYI